MSAAAAFAPIRPPRAPFPSPPSSPDLAQTAVFLPRLPHDALLPTGPQKQPLPRSAQLAASIAPWRPGAGVAGGAQAVSPGAAACVLAGLVQVRTACARCNRCPSGTCSVGPPLAAPLTALGLARCALLSALRRCALLEHLGSSAQLLDPMRFLATSFALVVGASFAAAAPTCRSGTFSGTNGALASSFSPARLVEYSS